ELLGIDLLASLVYTSASTESLKLSPWSAEVDTALQSVGNPRSDVLADSLPTPKYILMIICAATYSLKAIGYGLVLSVTSLRPKLRRSS
ncbi:hypothetical protein Pmar_PMAR026038, partial [Perkinsus marinus ATCC 50983]